MDIRLDLDFSWLVSLFTKKKIEMIFKEKEKKNRCQLVKAQYERLDEFKILDVEKENWKTKFPSSFHFWNSDWILYNSLHTDSWERERERTINLHRFSFIIFYIYFLFSYLKKEL